jgi:hypothetical protein
MVTKEQTIKTYTRADFQRLGYRREAFATVIEQTHTVFEGLVRTHGVATRFTFDQAVFLLIGMELVQCGISARHIARALLSLSLIEFNDPGRIKRFIEDRTVVWVFYSGGPYLEMTMDEYLTATLHEESGQDGMDNGRAKRKKRKKLETLPYSGAIGGRNLATGERRWYENKERTSLIEAVMYPMTEANKIREKGAMTCMVEIHLWTILQDLISP